MGTTTHGYPTERQRQMALERSLGVKAAATAYAEHEDGATELGSPSLSIYLSYPILLYHTLWYSMVFYLPVCVSIYLSI